MNNSVAIKNILSVRTLFIAFIFAGFFSFVPIANGFYNNSEIVKTQNDPAVYLVQSSNQKLIIPNEKIFLSYGFKWQDIKIISKEKLQNYTAAQYIRLNNSKNIYRLQTDGSKRLLNSSAKKFLNLAENNALTVSYTHLLFFKTGKVITQTELQKFSNNTQDSNSQSQSSQVQTGSNQITQADINSYYTELPCKDDPSVGGKDGCILYFALSKNNVRICDLATSQQWKGNCYGSFLPQNADVLSNCNLLTDEAYKFDCYAKIAVQKKDINICEKITDKDKKSSCQNYVGIVSKNLTTCANAADQEMCYFTYAVYNNDQNACSYILTSSKNRNVCDSYFQKSTAN